MTFFLLYVGNLVVRSESTDQIQYPIMKHITIAVLACLVALATTQHSYTNFRQLQNPSNFTKVVYADDLSFAIIYGETNQIGYAYRAYDWTPLADTELPRFFFPPNYMEYFNDATHSGNLIYSSVDGRIRKRSFSSSGFSELPLWAITSEDEPKNIRRVTANSDGTLYAAFSEGGSLVYIGDLTKELTLLQTKDFSALGMVNSIRWRPGTSQLIISGGGNDTDGRYFIIYDPIAQSEEDIVFISQGEVIDMDFNSDGSIMFFIEAIAMDTDVKAFDLASKNVKPLDTVIGVAHSLHVRGNFLTVGVKSSGQIVWDLASGKRVPISQPYITTDPWGTGLSPDGSDMLSFQLVGQKISLKKICVDLAHIYDSTTDTCLTCTSPCLDCFFEVTKCLTCINRYFDQGDYTCGACQLGCFTCQSADACQTCDSQNHWTQSGTNCTCSEGYLLLNQDTCTSCDSLMKGCSKCDAADVCQVCGEDYELNADTKKCDEKSSSSILLIILIIVGALVVVVVVIFIIRRRRAKQQSVLSAEPLEDYERVDEN